ncbi:MAG TPA: zf-HC2 domain-containing protein [Bryobacteraceae bacterium]|nr:zf-HC2 domain-containing protein [Bryobacteraceae bacterium]
MHATDHNIELYSLGRLAEPEATRFEEHLLMCEECQQRLEQEDRYTKALRSTLADHAGNSAASPRRTQPRGPWSFANWRWPSVAMAAAAVAAIFLMTVNLRTPREYQELTLSAQRGSERDASRARAGKRLKLHVDTTELASLAAYRVELVNSGGDPLWRETVRPVGTSLVAVISSTLDPGQYWLRVYEPDSNGSALREFGITVE